MKTIIVENLKIQFDSFDEGADQHNALNMIDEINSLLQERFPDAQPQIFVGEITKDFKIENSIEICSQDIDDLVVCALEGGINYWCNKAELTKEPEEKYELASDVISRGGELTLEEDDDCGNKHVLTKEKFLKGVSKAMENYDYHSVEELMDNHDAEVADVIIQFAIFDKIIYG